MIIDTNITTPKRVEKKWGYELWIHNDYEYCGKLLVFQLYLIITTTNFVQVIYQNKMH